MKFNLNILKGKKQDSVGSWLDLNSVGQIDDIVEQSKSDSFHSVVIFKHSTRCSISHMAMQRLQSNLELDPAKVPFYFLDLNAHRNVSDAVSERFQVTHESPQILIIRDGVVSFHTAHNGISADIVYKNAVA